MSFLSRLLRKNEVAHLGGHLYAGIGTAARHPAFFTDLQVPDTMDGRFDMLMLIQGLVSYVLMQRGEQTIAREMQEQLIRDMDRNLREIGVGDLSVGKQIKAMSSTLLGSQAAYHKALSIDDQTLAIAALAEAIGRNIYRDVEGAPADRMALAGYRLYRIWNQIETKTLAKGLTVDVGLEALQGE